MSSYGEVCFPLKDRQVRVVEQQVLASSPEAGGGPFDRRVIRVVNTDYKGCDGPIKYSCWTGAQGRGKYVMNPVQFLDQYFSCKFPPCHKKGSSVCKFVFTMLSVG